jgi:hypothetical protein
MGLIALRDCDHGPSRGWPRDGGLKAWTMEWGCNQEEPCSKTAEVRCSRQQGGHLSHVQQGPKAVTGKTGHLRVTVWLCGSPVRTNTVHCTGTLHSLNQPS